MWRFLRSEPKREFYKFHSLLGSVGEFSGGSSPSLACVAGGIRRASALVLVGSREHEWRSRERIGEESSWIPACPNSWGFLNYAFARQREFRIGWDYWNVNQMLIDTSHRSQGKRFVFIQCVKWGWQAYTTPTIRDICTYAVFFSVSRPFCRFTLVHEGHFVLCCEEKIEP